MRSVDAADNAAHRLRADSYINVVAFFQLNIVPAVTFFDGERKIGRQNLAVAHDDTVLVISGIEHLVIEVTHGGTARFGEEVGKTHTVGYHKHTRIVDRS